MMKFIASDRDGAKAKARRALGEQAVIVSMRDLPSGDVEVTASNKPAPVAPPLDSHEGNAPGLGAPSVEKTGRDAPPVATRPLNGSAGFAQPSKGAHPPPHDGDLDAGGHAASPQFAPAPDGRTAPRFARDAREAIDEGVYRPSAGARLNEQMEQRFTEDAFDKLRGDLSSGGGAPAPAPIHNLSPAKQEAMRALLKPHGVGDLLMRDLMAGAGQARMDDDYHRLEVAFAETFDFTPLSFHATHPIMLVGPTGAGKTSSSAKLAKAAIEAGGPAFMMTADVGRAGAIEQLKTYGDSLGADYFIVETPQDVEKAMDYHRPQGAVILDTPGVSPFDGGDVAALKSFQEAARAEPVLVLPASGDGEEFVDWALAFAEFGVRRAIITKFDATKRIGAGLRAAHAGNMALAHFSETAFISEGLLPACAEFLARRFLASQPGRVG